MHSYLPTYCTDSYCKDIICLNNNPVRWIFSGENLTLGEFFCGTIWICSVSWMSRRPAACSPNQTA